MNNGKQVRAFLDALRAGKYTSVGAYPLYHIMADCGALCVDCARQEVWVIARATRDGYEKEWCYLAAEVNWEDPNMYCTHCSERIESAYAEPTGEWT